MPKFNRNRNNMKKYNVSTKRNGYKLSMDFGDLGDKLDLAQLVLDTQVWQDVQRYMPIDTGALISETNAKNATVLGSGKVYVYPPDNPYAHYQYEGVVYKDPVYNFAGLYDPDRGWFSRKGVTKVPSSQMIQYSQPNARRDWAKVAIDKHGNEWVDLVRRTISR